MKRDEMLGPDWLQLKTDLSETQRRASLRGRGSPLGWNFVKTLQRLRVAAAASQEILGGGAERMEGPAGRSAEMGGRTLKEDLQVERSEACELVQHEGKDDPEEVLDEAAQQSQLQPPLPQQATFLSNTISEVHLSERNEHSKVLDTVRENQETLQMVLMNQETLKGLTAKLLKAVSSIEEKVQAMGQEMGTLSQFTQELNQVGDESNWA
nr:uncharacterized protein LOC110091185 [Pogona vitticeps]